MNEGHEFEGDLMVILKTDFPQTRIVHIIGVKLHQDLVVDYKELLFLVFSLTLSLFPHLFAFLFLLSRRLQLLNYLVQLLKTDSSVFVLFNHFCEQFFHL